MTPKSHILHSIGFCDRRELQLQTKTWRQLYQMRDSWNQPPLARLSQLYYQIEESFLLTFEELDHYPNRGTTTYWGARPYTKVQSSGWSKSC